MSYISTVIQSCPNVQTELTNLFNIQNLGLKLVPLPLLEFVTSTENTSGLSIQEVVSPGKSKLRTVEARYFQRLMEADVASNQSNPNCTATNKVGDLVTSYSIDPDVNLQIAKRVELRDLTTSCRDNPEYFNSLMIQMMDALERKIADQLVSDLAALNGKWATPVTGVVNDQLVVNTLNAGSVTDLAPFTMENIDLALMQTGFESSAIFSGASLYKYYRRMKASCCADSGANLMEIMAQYGQAVRYDQKFEAIYGVDRAIVLKPGAIAMLHWTYAGWKEGVNPKLTPTNTGFKDVVFGFRTGLPFDLSVTEASCGSYIDIVITATTKTVGLPSDMYQDSDIYDGVNFVNEIKVTNT